MLVKYCWARGPSSNVVNIPNETLLEEITFPFGCQLQIASWFSLGALDHVPLPVLGPSVAQSFAYCHCLCELICPSTLLNVEDAVRVLHPVQFLQSFWLFFFFFSRRRRLISYGMFQSFSVSAPCPVVGLSVSFRQKISCLKLLNCDLYGYMLQYKTSLVKYSGFLVSDK